MTEREYPKEAIARAREGAFEWLSRNSDGYPRSWEQEARDDKRRGYTMYDGDDAPPIAGYEALESEGLAVRMDVVTMPGGQQRIHFRLNAEIGRKEE